MNSHEKVMNFHILIIVATLHLSVIKTFTITMNLDFLGYRSSVDHVKMLKYLLSRGIRISVIFCGVELPLEISIMQGQV